MNGHTGRLTHLPPLGSGGNARTLWYRATLTALVGLGVACSSRIPVKPEPTTDSRDEVSGAFEPNDGVSPGPNEGADAASTPTELPGETNDASLQNPASNHDTPSQTLSSGGLASDASTPALTVGDLTSSGDTAGDGTNTNANSSFVVDPVPTRQLSIPLPNADVKFAILVSVDGLAPRFLEQVMSEGHAPTFTKLQSLAAWTHNARTDKTHTYTLPNHTCMLTGLPVQPVPGLESYRAHFYVANTDPAPGATLHQLRFPEHTYTPSMFDVAHDNGLATAMFASKTKFSLFSQTYNDAGGPDTIGFDNGARKIDKVVLNVDPAAMVGELVTQLKTLPPHLTFVHLNQPDGAGHSLGWGSPEYLTAVSAMDALLGQILTTIQQGQLKDRTALIVTADHGGVDYSHLTPDDALNFRIPFYVMAPGVAPGDIYASLEHRVAPDAATNPGYDELSQPIRNGDAGNVALDLLGLDPIPDSVIHGAGLLTAL